MRILYGIQGTGNGHISRARAMLPALSKFAHIDILISGKNYSADLGFPVRYRKNGLSYTFGKNGGIDFWDSAKKFRPIQFIKDIREIPVEDYDLVISDFEPLTAWACASKDISCIGLSHQAAFSSLKTPRPPVQEKLGELIFRNYAPCDVPLGIHYQDYDDFIFTPMIRPAIREAKVNRENHISVYLPAFDDRLLLSKFRPLTETHFHIFSRSRRKITHFKNITIFPVSGREYIESITSSKGMILASGFESTSEALYLGKRLFTIPMKNQYEQACNASALKQFGATVVSEITDSFTEEIFHWLGSPQPQRIHFPEVTDKIAACIFEWQSMHSLTA